MLKGKIININSSKYLVESNKEKYSCSLRGIFRKEKITPLVGDDVEFDEKDLQIKKILPRENFLLRPNVANASYAIIMVSVKKPDLDLYLLDKLLVHIISSKITPVICFSKIDLLDNDKDIKKLKKYYNDIGISAYFNTEKKAICQKLKGKVALLCGQTGSGKSTFINSLDENLHLETKPISESLNRGVHTTRYVSLYPINDFFLVDTPGFSALDISMLSEEKVRNAFFEFSNYLCKYKDCSHINTDGCEVSKVVGKEILLSRYENYQKIIKEYHENSSKLFKK